MKSIPPDTPLLYSKTGVCRVYLFFLIFAPKHRLWVLVKTASPNNYDMFHGIKYLIVGLVFSDLGFWSGGLFLVAPLPDLCLLVPSDEIFNFYS